MGRVDKFDTETLALGVSLVTVVSSVFSVERTIDRVSSSCIVSSRRRFALGSSAIMDDVSVRKKVMPSQRSGHEIINLVLSATTFMEARTGNNYTKTMTVTPPTCPLKTEDQSYKLHY